MNWYYGPWVWDERLWRAPLGCVGIDLRTLPQQGTRGGEPGMSLFAGDLTENAADYIFIGRGHWSEVKPDARLRRMLGHAAAGDTLADIVLSLISDRSDPAGHDAARPLMPSVGGSLDLHCAGMSAHAAYRWGQRHTSKIRDVIRGDFAAAWEANPTHARKVLDYWSGKHAADWRQFVPPPLLPHVPGPLPHETTIADTFDRADGPIGTSSEGWSWSNVTGTWNIYSNAAGASAGSAWLVCQAATDLSSTDQYSQVVIGATKEYYGPAVRVAGSGLTFYQFSADSSRSIYKLVAGTQTIIASTAGTQAGGQTWKIEANGSTIRGLVNGSQILSVTDTAISSGLRAGIAGYNASGYGVFASFEAADLPPPSPVNTVAPAVSGTAQVGQTLTTTNGTWDNTPTSYNYQWKRADDSGFTTNVTNIGTDQNTFVLTASELSKYVRCVVTATNAGGSTPANSNVTSQVLPAVPVNSLAPAVTPTAGATGDTFSCTTGTWTNTPTSYAYQWKLDGSNVGTNASTYAPVATGSLTCVVTASNAGGPGTPATSNAATVSEPPSGGANAAGISGFAGVGGLSSFR